MRVVASVRDDSAMRILVIAGEVPATSNMPGSPRLFSLCKYLSQDHSLTLATTTEQPARHQAFLADPVIAGVFDEVVILPKPPAPRWLGQQVHRIWQEAHFATRLRNRIYHKEMVHRIETLVREGGFDLVYVDGLGSAQYVMDSDIEGPTAVDLHDCLTLLYSRKLKLERNWLERLRLYAQTRSLARWERSLSSMFDVIITNSRVDERFLKSLDPAANTLTIGNGVDTEFFRPSGGTRDMSTLVFTGVMDYGPNEDAVLYFADAILPLIQAQSPGVKFMVVGKDPTQRVQALAARPGIRVVGEVPDVRPYVNAAGIFVCPLRWGAGVKNKLLAALAMEKAAVATRQSVEGLELREDVDLLLADEPAAFAAKTLQLIDDPALARRLGQSGREHVRATYSWESNARILEDTLMSLVHRHKSTRSKKPQVGPAA